MTLPNDKYPISKPVPIWDPAFSRREFLGVVSLGTLACLCSGLMQGCDSGPRDIVLDGPLHFASLTDVARLIESGKLSSVELTELMLKRIETIDDHLMSYATLMADQALEAARSADE